MADKKVTDLGTPSGGVASEDKLYLVDVSDTTDNAAGSSRADTLANVVTKGHGLSDGIVKVATGTMTAASAGTDYYAPGSTDVAVADGGTGASDAATARTNLGLAIGTDVQAYDADLADIAGITPSQGDIIYRNATNWVRLGAGSAGQFLSSGGAGANVSWASGALASYDAIVASSGGNYTTLGAAIAAASAGWRILVLDSTTETGAITSALNNLTIEGAGREGVVVNMASYVLTLSGTGVTVQNLGFNLSNASSGVSFSGARATLLNNTFDLVSGGATSADKVDVSGTDSVMMGCNITTTSTITNTATANILSWGGADGRIIGNYFKIHSGGVQTTNHCPIYIIGANVIFANNYIVQNSFYTDSSTINSVADYTIISNNVFYGTSTTAYDVINMGGAGHVVTDNVLRCGARAILSASYGTISNNTILLGTTTGALGIRIYSNFDRTVTGNIVRMGVGGTGGDGIKVEVNEVTVSGNRVKGFANGVNISSSTAENVIVTGNSLTGCTVGIADSGIASRLSNNSNTSLLFAKDSSYMKNTSGGTINAGNVVVYKSVAAGDEITTTTTAGDDKVFGVATAAISTGSYGHIQRLGKVTTLTVNGTTDIAIGDFLTTFTTAGIAAKAAAGDMVFAIALEAYTGDDSNGVIDALIISPRLI